MREVIRMVAVSTALSSSFWLLSGGGGADADDGHAEHDDKMVHD